MCDLLAAGRTAMSLPAGTDIQPPAHAVSTTCGCIHQQVDSRFRRRSLWEPEGSTRMASRAAQ
jgi:hypothetical protein